jgi:hypothetical protein
MTRAQTATSTISRMGGFDAYAMQIHIEFDGPALESTTLNALQRALAAGAPGWSSRARLSSLGRWRVGDTFDMDAPGALEAVLRAWLPGGAKAPPTVLGRDTIEDADAVLTGADRSAVLTLYLRPDRWPAVISATLETTAKEVDGMPAGVWVERVFRALAREVAPAHIAADTLGERMGRHKRDTGNRRAGWLTYLGAHEAARVDRAGLGAVEGVEVAEVSGGLLLRLDPTAGPRRGERYWARAAAVERLVVPVSPMPTRPARPELRGRRSAPDHLHVPAPSVAFGPGGTRIVSGGRYEGVRFAQLLFTAPGGVLQGFEAVRCEFDNSHISGSKGLERPVVVRNCTLTRCKWQSSSIGPALVEDCVVDGLSGAPLGGAAELLLRHVVVKGAVDVLWIGQPLAKRGWLGRERSDARAHRLHYAATDWALDISGARFRRCDIPGVPGHLVRRDPATQVLIRRERLVGRDTRELAGDTYWSVVFDSLLKGGRESEVLVACQRGTSFQEELATISRLREAGVADPD